MNKLVNPLTLLENYAGEMPTPVYDMLFELGLGPDFLPMEENVSGWISRDGSGRYRVAINRDHAHVRQRFTAAHELAHYLYHRDLIGAGVGDTRAYRTEGTPYPNSAVLPMHERQANSFAANILMPKESIARLQRQGFTDIEEMAKRLEVSTEALRIRLGMPKPIPSPAPLLGRARRRNINLG